MALIKKYKSGNKIDKTGFKDFITTKFATGELKDSKVLDYINSDQSFDPDNKLVKNLYDEYNKTKPVTVKIEYDLKKDKNIGNLRQDIIKSQYGDDELSFFDEWEKDLDNSSRKTKLSQQINRLTGEYLEQQDLDKIGHKWQDLDTIRELNTLTSGEINDETWNKINSLSNSLKWGLNEFLLTDDQVKSLAEASNQEKQALQQKTDFDNKVSTLSGIGLTNPEQFAQQGWTIDSEYEPLADKPFLQNYLKEKGITRLINPQGQSIYIQEGKQLGSISDWISEDVFNPNYGYSFSIDGSGFRLYNPGENTNLKSDYKDPGNILSELLYEDTDNTGYRYFGSSGDSSAGEYGKDVLGRRNLLHQIQRFAKDSEIPNIFTLQDGKYVDSLGRTIELPSFTGFGESTDLGLDEIAQLTKNENSPIYGIPVLKPKARNTGNVSDRAVGMYRLLETKETTLSDIEEDLKKYQVSSNNRIHPGNSQRRKFRELIGNLLWFKQNGSDDDKSRVDKILIEQIMPISTYYLKKGGVIKAENGISTARLLELSKKYATPIETTKPKEQKKENEVFNTVGKMAGLAKDPLKAISLAGSVASVIPGVGVIGGAVSTAADAIHGAQDGWDKQDWINLGTNLGFTALAGFGLGGLKIAGQAAKAGKTAVTASKVASASKKVSKLKNMKLIDEATEQSIKKVNTFVSELGKDANTVFKAIDKGEDIIKIPGKRGTFKPEFIKNLKSDLAKVEEVSNMTTSLAGSYAKHAAKPIKAVGNLFTSEAPKVVKGAAIAGQLYGTGTGALQLGTNVHEYGWREGIGRTDVDAIRNIIQGAAIGRIYLKNRRTKNDYALNTKTTSDGQLKIGDNTYNTGDKTVNLYKNKRFNILKSDKELTEELKKVKDGNVEELLKLVKDSKGKGITVSSPGNLTVIDKPNLEFYGGDAYRANEALERIRKILQTGQSNYGSWNYYNRFWGSNLKKGGIIKYQNPSGPIIYNKREPNIKTYKVKPTTTNLLPYTRVQDINPNWQYDKGYTTAYSNFVKGIDVDFYNKYKDDLAQFVKEQGGSYVAKDYVDLQRLAEDGLFGPHHNWIYSRFGNDINNISKPSTLATVPSLNIPTIKPIKTDVKNQPISIGNELLANESGKGSFEVEQTPIVPFSLKPYRDNPIIPIAEGLRYAAIQRGNNLSLRHQIQALNDKIGLYPTMPKYHFTTSRVNTELANKKANEMVSSGDRIANSISDIDKANAVQLESDKNASNIALQGAYRDFDANQKVLQLQANHNFSINQFNLQQVSRNIQEIRNSLYGMGIARAQHANQSGLNTANLIAGLGSHYSGMPYRKAINEYSQTLNNPNYQNTLRNINYLQTTGLENAKREFENSAEKFDNVTFENSNIYNALIEQIKREQAKLIPFQNQIRSKEAQVTSLQVAREGGKIVFK